MSETLNKKQKRRLKKKKILRKVKQKTQRNKQIIKKIKIISKNIRKAINLLKTNYSEESKSKIEEMLKNFYQEIDKAVSKGIVHKNEASRRKSRLTKQFNQVLKSSQNLSKV